MTQFSATQAAQGMEFLGRAGFKTTDIISAMPGLLIWLRRARLELRRAADIASNVLSGFQLQAKESNRVADILALTAASANTNVEQLGDAMSPRRASSISVRQISRRNLSGTWRARQCRHSSVIRRYWTSWHPKSRNGHPAGCRRCAK